MSGNSYEGLFHDAIPLSWINQPIIAAEDITTKLWEECQFYRIALAMALNPDVTRDELTELARSVSLSAESAPVRWSARTRQAFMHVMASSLGTGSRNMRHDSR